MKVLLDSCVWGGARTALAAERHDVVWAGDWPSDPGDDEILATAHQRGAIITVEPGRLRIREP